MTWDSSNGADLHIMGPQSDVSKMLGSCNAQFRSSFGDMFAGDVNVEFDMMYGPPKGEGSVWLGKISRMPFYVTVNEGEVVLNAPGEIVDLVGSKITISEIKVAIEDHVIPAFEMGKEAYDIRMENKLNKTLCTVTIGIGPMGKNYATGSE